MSTLFFAQEGEFGLGAHHGDEDQRKAHEHEGGGPLIGEEDGEEHAEGGLQGEEHGGGGGGGVLLADVLEQEGTAGGADDQVRQAHDQAAVKYAGRQRRAGDQYPQPGKEGEGGKLEGGEDEDVPSLGVSGHGHDVGGEEEAADEGEHIAHVEGGGVVPGDGHQGDPPDAQEGGNQVEPVGAALGDEPVQEGDDDAVDGGKEGVLAGGGLLQAEGLEGVGQKQAEAHHRAADQVLLIQHLPPPDEHHRQHQGRKRKADGQQPEGGQHVHAGLHHHEGAAPDDGGQDQQRAGEAGQDAALFVFGHGCTSPLTMIKSGLHTFTGKRGFEHVLIRL